MSYSPRRPEQLVEDVDRDRVLTDPERVALLASAQRWCRRAVANDFGHGDQLYGSMRTWIARQSDRHQILERSPLIDVEPVDLDALEPQVRRGATHSFTHGIRRCTDPTDVLVSALPSMAPSMGTTPRATPLELDALEAIL